MLTAAQRLEKLRGLLRTKGLDALIIPTADAHNSEYPPPYALRRHYLTGFTGSAGVAVVTQNEALLWTDGRYFVQASQQLDPSLWTLMRDGLPTTPSLHEWLKQKEGVHTVGYDPLVTTITAHKVIDNALKEAFPPKDYVPTSENLVDLIWGSDGQPGHPASKVFHLPHSVSGVSAKEKLTKIREVMAKERADGCVLAYLDDVAWITNLRGSDIPFCPTFLAYFFLTKDHATRLEPDATAYLAESQIAVKPYHTIFDDIKAFYGNSQETTRVWMDGATNYRLYTCVTNPHQRVLVKISPVQSAKAIKNPVELEAMKEAHIKDALAECTFLAWLENLAATNEAELKTWTEWTVGEKLGSLRKMMPNNKGLSFNTISSIGPNGAVIHYAPDETSSLSLSRDLYLVDSGGQYLEGTTDITRTLHLGTPSALQKEMFTRVLKGHLCLVRQAFPRGTKGPQLDVLARQFLWQCGLNYLHGTGHGVGAFLNVHEGPQRISSDLVGTGAETSLEPGMIVSNEPGFYLEGKFGIRIENLVYVRELKQLHENQTLDFYGFADLTMIPYQKKMVELSLLSDEELEQFNAYHAMVWKVLEPRLKACTCLPDKDATLKWLKEATSPLTRH